MKAIVFVDTNKSGSSRDGLKAAKKLGYFIHVLTNRASLLKRNEEFSEIDEIHKVELKKKECIREAIINIQSTYHVVCIISFIDPYVQVAAELSNDLCDTNISAESIKIMGNKALTRTHLKSKKYSPHYFVVQQADVMKNVILQLKGNYPVVMKLPDSTGSKDVFFIKNESQLRNRMRHLRKMHPYEEILIEKYVEGPQFIVEAIVYEGNIQIAAVVAQEITQKKRFIVTGYSLSSKLDSELHSELIKVSREIISDLGLQNGNCHLELRCSGEEWKLIEANPRMSGGVMNRLIEEAYGFNYAEQIIKVYVGDRPLLVRERESCVYAHYLTVSSLGTLEKVTGTEQARKEPGVVDIHIKPKNGQTVTPPLSMGHRYGYVLAKGETESEAKERALQAAGYIHFHLDPI